MNRNQINACISYSAFSIRIIKKHYSPLWSFGMATAVWIADTPRAPLIGRNEVYGNNFAQTALEHCVQRALLVLNNGNGKPATTYYVTCFAPIGWLFLILAEKTLETIFFFFLAGAFLLCSAGESSKTNIVIGNRKGTKTVLEVENGRLIYIRDQTDSLMWDNLIDSSTN